MNPQYLVQRGQKQIVCLYCVYSKDNMLSNCFNDEDLNIYTFIHSYLFKRMILDARISSH
jgi:hypothetical protein